MSDEYVTPNGFEEATRPPPSATRTIMIDGIPVQIEITKEDRATKTKVYFFCEEWLNKKKREWWNRGKYFFLGVTQTLVILAYEILRGAWS